jgi:hypothetical protein
VQYHPEAAAGPHDAAYLFDRFCELMTRTSSVEPVQTTRPVTVATSSTEADGEDA